MKLNRFLAGALLLLSSSPLFAQDDLSKLLGEDKSDDIVSATFKTTRLNMAHSIETVGAHQLDFRVSHVFGGVGKAAGGGTHNLWGFDQIANMRIAFEYGVTDRLTASIGRSKGFGSIHEVYDGHLKYKLLRQTTRKTPVTITLLGGINTTGMTASSDSTSAASFHNGTERLTYISQVMIARKFNTNLSIQIMPTYIHRNYVAANDENDVFAIGVGGRLKFSKRSAIIIDYFMPFSKSRTAAHKAGTYYYPLGIGYEIETGGHVFHLTLVNTGGFTEDDFILNSPTSWTKWGFRFGFNISRPFRIY